MSQNSTDVFKLDNRLGFLMRPRRDACEFEFLVKNIFAETPVSLAIIDNHLLHNFFSGGAPEAARLRPLLIDAAVP